MASASIGIVFEIPTIEDWIINFCWMGFGYIFLLSCILKFNKTKQRSWKSKKREDEKQKINQPEQAYRYHNELFRVWYQIFYYIFAGTKWYYHKIYTWLPICVK